VPKAVLPAYRDTSATTQIIKLDLSYEPGGYLLEDSFRGEFYNLNQSANTRSGYFFVDGFAGQSEQYSHFQAANAFRVGKQVNSWCYVSGGYLYTHVDGDESFERAAGSLVTAPAIDAAEQAPSVAVEQHSNTINANVLLGPWAGLSVVAGAQADWQQRDGSGELAGISFGFPYTNALSANLDKSAVAGDLGVRYTKIPFTVVYGEAKLGYETYDLYESSFVFLQDTTSTANLQDYQAGVTISPWQRVSLDVSYRYHSKRTSYNDGEANDPTIDNGYSGFFRELDITSGDFEARLTLRPISWLKATLKYQLLNTEYRNDVSPSLVFIFPSLVLYPGGSMLSGDYDASVYSLNLTLTPWRRLFLSTTFSYADSRMVSGINNYPGVAPSIVAPYDGQIYSLTASANYALNKSTDLTATYLFSKSNFQQDNLEGLPLGIVYDRNAVLAGVRRRFSKNVMGSLQYAYYTYNEPSSAGINNYRANTVFATVKLLLP
jgi:hypothetical protein